MNVSHFLLWTSIFFFSTSASTKQQKHKVKVKPKRNPTSPKAKRLLDFKIKHSKLSSLIFETFLSFLLVYKLYQNSNAASKFLTQLCKSKNIPICEGSSACIFFFSSCLEFGGNPPISKSEKRGLKNWRENKQQIVKIFFGNKHLSSQMPTHCTLQESKVN